MNNGKLNSFAYFDSTQITQKNFCNEKKYDQETYFETPFHNTFYIPDKDTP